MKNMRTYLLGVGSGLLLAALLTGIMPDQPSSPAGSDPTLNSELTSPAGSDPTLDPAKESPDENVVPSPLDSTESLPEEKVAVGEGDEVLSFVVPEGATASGIADSLVSLGLIESQADFLNRVTELGVAASFQAGTFSLNKKMSLDDLISELIR